MNPFDLRAERAVQVQNACTERQQAIVAHPGTETEWAKG